MKHLSIFLFTIVSIQFTILQAQVKTDFNNNNKVTSIGKFSRTYKTDIDFIIPSKNISNLLKLESMEAAKSNETKPFQLATPVPIDLDIVKLIDWIYEDNFAYGKYTFKVDGALSTSINFDKFSLPKGTEMYVYNENGNMITGPVTDNENNASRVWGSWVYKGQYLTIEIKTPTTSIKELSLHSNNVAYGYKEIYKAIGFGNSGTCQINVICPLGNGWEPERNSVALILSENGGYWCSGSMVMNSCNTNRPFFLTANHCFLPPGLQQQDVTKWRFNFQDWSPVCSPSQNAAGVTYNGSTLRANWGNSDFCLVELINTPPTNSGINYAGWTKSTTPAVNATGIHHPNGDVMKISRGNNSVTIASTNGTVNQHWRVNWSAQNNGAGQMVTAVTEGGSSGSPLFDQDHRIIGQLTGGPSICGGTQLWDFYGRFDLSWTGGGTNATRLSNWLDPNNTGAMTTNTTNISSLASQSLNGLTITGNSSFCSNSSYTVNGVPSGATVTWTSSNTNIFTVTPNGNPATVTKVGDGGATITAKVGGNCFTNNVISKVIYAGVPLVSGSYSSGSNLYSMSEWQGSEYNYACVGVAPATLTLMNLPNATSVVWKKIFSTGSFNWFQTGNNVNINFTQPGQQIYLEVKVTNSCGTTTKTYMFQSTNCSSLLSYIVSPNPSYNEINITTINKEKAIKEIRITDKSGNTKKSLKLTTKESHAKLNISSLPADVYYIQIFDGKKWESKIIIKQ